MVGRAVPRAGSDLRASWQKRPSTGRFQRWHATISFDPAHPESGHARVTVDMASAVTGDKQKDAALPQSEWFDVKTFPEAVFEVQSFRPNGTPSSYDAIATLTMRGVKMDLTMPLSIEVNGDTLHAKGGVEPVALEIRRGARAMDKRAVGGARSGDGVRCNGDP